MVCYRGIQVSFAFRCFAESLQQIQAIPFRPADPGVRFQIGSSGNALRQPPFLRCTQNLILPEHPVTPIKYRQSHGFQTPPQELPSCRLPLHCGTYPLRPKEYAHRRTVDKGDATEYFYDVSRCGGIEVGGYIDYAWHGYFSSTEELQIINPNLDGSVQTYSKYTRRSIAGLTETRYGCVNVPRYSSNDPNIRNRAADIICKWKSGGNKKSNILIYGDDLIGNEYGDRENAARIMLGDYSLLQFMDDGDGWDFSRDELIWGDVVYSGVSLDPGVEHAAGNTYRKDW